MRFWSVYGKDFTEMSTKNEKKHRFRTIKLVENGVKQAVSGVYRVCKKGSNNRPSFSGICLFSLSAIHKAIKSDAFFTDSVKSL